MELPISYCSGRKREREKIVVVMVQQRKSRELSDVKQYIQQRIVTGRIDNRDQL